MEKLAIRLGSNPQDPVHWLVWSDTEKEIIASGELPDMNALDQLKERAPNALVVGIVPSCDVVLKTVQLPLKANRKVLNAIPFMLEDELASDISKSFFAFGKRIGDSQQVAIVTREKLLFWQEALKQANLYCDLLVPDVLALPYSDNNISLLSMGNSEHAPLIVRADEWAGFQGEQSWAYPLLEKQLNAKPLSVTVYSELQHSDYLEALVKKQQDDSEEVTASEEQSNQPNLSQNYDKLPMQLLLDGALDAKFNLLQGEFVVKRKTNAQWDKWRLAAVLAAIALCVNLVGKTLELNSIKSQRQSVESRLQASIKKGFPNLPKSRNKEAAIKKEMARLEQGGGGISMIVMLTQMSPSFANTGVTPQSIRYDASRTELRMQSVASNFESLEKFRREVQALGFEVDQGAINNQGDQVIGTVVIKG
ncbi:type II secretion system protein GspL [Glaciecola sp. MF2-115]|uniref:type II secretion system protein GspL n=1 Tax=Glaciecola sp. MF2-115 TaxID=3384827 RepID=UPI0039A32ED6